MPKMSKAQFELIAQVLKNAQDANKAEQAENIINQGEFEAVEYRLATLVEDFAHELAATNPQFDTSRFLDACTPDYLKEIK